MLLKREADFLEYLNRCAVVRRDDAKDPADAERATSMLDYTGSSFRREAPAPELREERVADIRVIELCAAQQSAHSDWLTGFLAQHHVHAEAVFSIARDGAVDDISRGLLGRMHASISDVLEE